MPHHPISNLRVNHKKTFKVKFCLCNILDRHHANFTIRIATLHNSQSIMRGREKNFSVLIMSSPYIAKIKFTLKVFMVHPVTSFNYHFDMCDKKFKFEELFK